MAFEHSDYRELLHERLQKLKISGKAVNLHKASQRIGVQYTYLSKVLSSRATTHLGEDKLSALCMYLEMDQEEEDFVFLLKSHQTSDNTQRKDRLFAKISAFKEAHKLNVPRAQFDRLALERETEYLLNPLAVITHICLNVRRFKKRPLDLAEMLGVSISDIKETLKLLERHGLLVMNADRNGVKELSRRRSHLGLEHPLVRSHQMAIREFCKTRLSLCSNQKKKSFTALFTADKEVFGKIRVLFENFLKEAQDLAEKSTNTDVFQLNFDLFPILKE